MAVIFDAKDSKKKKLNKKQVKRYEILDLKKWDLQNKKILLQQFSIRK